MKKNLKTAGGGDKHSAFLACLFALMILVVFTGCPQAAIPVGSVSIDHPSLVLAIGETATLTATVLPENATDRTVIWTTSNAEVAAVDNGTVKAVREGTATITAKAGEKSAACEVTVEPAFVPVTSVELDTQQLTLAVGQSHEFSVKVFPEDATEKNVKWSTTDQGIATVIDGKVTACSVGTAEITATSVDGEKTASATISVVDAILGPDASLSNLADLETRTSLTLAGELSDKDFLTIRGLTNLQTLDISETANTVLPYTAFYESYFSEIDLPAGLKKIGAWAFGHSCIESLDIPYGVSEIGDSAFAYCSNLKTLTIPGSVETVGGWILQHTDDYGTITTENRTVVTLEEGIGNLSTSSFWGAPIESISIPASVKTIPDWCFSSSSLKTIELHDGITSIGECAFYLLSNLTSIGGALPSSLTEIGADAFCICSSLEFDDAVLVIPASVDSIGSRAFSNCSKIERVVFEQDEDGKEGVESIDPSAFNGIVLEEIVLPSTLSAMADSAFSYSVEGGSIYFNSVEPPKLVMTVDTAGAPLAPLTGKMNTWNVYVPSGSVEAYKNSDWCSNTGAVYGSTGGSEYFNEDNVQAIN